jgi:hypothetical protein
MRAILHPFQGFYPTPAGYLVEPFIPLNILPNFFAMPNENRR